MDLQNNITRKNTIYDHFQEILSQNSLMQHVTSSLASSLQTSMMLLPQSKLTEISFNTQMKEVSEKIAKMIQRIKEFIESEFSTIHQVNHQLDKIADGLRKVIDLGKYQEEKSSFVLAQLQNQLRCKEAEIKDCQSALKKQTKKKSEERWKQQYYLSRNKQINLTPDSLYVELLKQCAKKIETQIRFQKKESDNLQNRVSKIMDKFKINLIDVWSQMFEKDTSIRSTKKISPESNPEDRYSQIENEFVNKQKAVDLFDFSKLQHIKKRLRLLQQAEMSEFHQYQSYSISGSQHEVIEQSEIARILPF